MKKVLQAYCDGSYNKKTHLCSYGVIILDEKDNIIIEYGDSVCDNGYCNMRNVGGEIKGAESAMEYADKYGCDKLIIYHDYMGISEWALGKWKTNNEYTRAYKEKYDKYKDKFEIEFKHIRAHSGNKNNDLADSLAKSFIL